MLEIDNHYLDGATLLIIAAFSILVGWCPLWRKRLHKRKSAALPRIPGPRPLPFLGTSWVFSAFGGYKVERMHEFFADLRARYGSVVKEEAFFNVPVVHLFDRGDIERVLRGSGRYPLRPPCEAMAHYRRSRPDRYASTGMVNEQGETWSLLRASLTPAITSPKTIGGFLPQIRVIADDWCHLLKISRDKRDGRIGNVKVLAEKLGIEMTCALVLGRRMGLLLPGEESETANKLAAAVHEHFLATRDTYYGFPFWKFFRTPAYRRLAKSEGDIYGLVLELIESSDEAVRESEVFQSVLRADIDEREKTAAIVDYIAAGIHTTKNTVLFLLHLVGQRPEVQAAILADDASKAFGKACLQEAFRLHSTASVLCRVTEQALEVGGGRYSLPAGSVVICQSGAACRDPDNFDGPDDFRPERWMGEERTRSLQNSAGILIPFGHGKRMCPGKRFIEQVLLVVLEHTVRSFRLSPEEPLEDEFEFVLGPKGPVPMTFRDRIED